MTDWKPSVGATRSPPPLVFFFIGGWFYRALEDVLFAGVTTPVGEPFEIEFVTGKSSLRRSQFNYLRCVTESQRTAKVKHAKKLHLSNSLSSTHVWWVISGFRLGCLFGQNTSGIEHGRNMYIGTGG